MSDQVMKDVDGENTQSLPELPKNAIEYVPKAPLESPIKKLFHVAAFYLHFLCYYYDGFHCLGERHHAGYCQYCNR